VGQRFHVTKQLPGIDADRRGPGLTRRSGDGAGQQQPDCEVEHALSYRGPADHFS
jgi:hypothetical protein